MLHKFHADYLKIGINTIVLSIGKIFSISLGLISIVFLTRYLGPSGYGNYTLVFSYLSLFSIFSDFGLQLLIVKELAADRDTKPIYGTYFYLKIFLVFTSTLLALVFLIFVPYTNVLKEAIIVGSIAVAFSNIGTYGSAIFQAKLDLPKITIIDNATKLITVISIILFILLKMNFYLIIFTVLLGNLMGLGLTMYYLRKIVLLPLIFDMKLAQTLLLKSIPIGLTSFFAFAYFKIDILMLSIMKNSTEVGLYALAYKCLENLLIFWSFYMATVYPLLAKLYGSDDKKKLRKLVNHSIIIAFTSSVIIVFLSQVFASNVVYLFGGKTFSGSIFSLRILLLALPILFMNNLWYNIFLVYDKTKLIIIAMVLTLLLNIILNLLFIPLYGYIAASYITVMCEVVMLVCYIVLFQLKFNKNTED